VKVGANKPADFTRAIVHDVTGAVPQPPVEAVLWLTNHLAARGLTLEAGPTVLCGTHSPIWYHKGPGRYGWRCQGSGRW